MSFQAQIWQLFAININLRLWKEERAFLLLKLRESILHKHTPDKLFKKILKNLTIETTLSDYHSLVVTVLKVKNKKVSPN